MDWARAGSLAVVPRIFPIDPYEDLAVANGFVWELSQWMPGQCFQKSELSSDRISDAVATIAAIHLAVVDKAQRQQPAPAALNRIRRIDELSKLADFHKSQFDDRKLAELAVRIIPIWDRFHSSVRYRLREAADSPTHTQWVLRDVHKEHVLWHSNAGDTPCVSGIIDYDAVQIDTPAADVARFLGSCELGDSGQIDAAVDVYNELFPRATIDANLVRLLDQATCLIAAVNWLIWLGLERREYAAGRRKALDRFREMVERAEILFH